MRIWLEQFKDYFKKYVIHFLPHVLFSLLFCQCIHQLDRTPLIAASGSGFPGVVRILLDRIKYDTDREAHLNAVMEVSYNICAS